MEIYYSEKAEGALAEAMIEMQVHAPLLRAVNQVATNLIESGPGNYEEEIARSLRIIGQAVDVDRAYIWENFEQDGHMLCRQIFEWSEGAEAQQGKDFTMSLDYEDIPYWKERLLSNRSVSGKVKDFPDNEVLLMQGIVSILLIPIYIYERPWGFIGFDDCRTERSFAKIEEYVLQTSGILMISSLLRNSMTRQLIEASEELKVQDALLHAVNDVAALLQETRQNDFLATVRQALETMCECTGADRASIWRNYDDAKQGLSAACLASWNKNRRREQALEGLSFAYDIYLPEWSRAGAACNEPIYKINEDARKLFFLEGYQSLFLLPINMHGDFWGMISFSYQQEGRFFSEPEESILRSGGLLIASAVMRNEMTEALVKAREDALASARAKSDFLSRMSHEIRTPMNAIIGMTNLAQKSDDLSQVRRYLGIVDSSSRQLLSLINDILDMSKIDANKMEIIRREFNFENMLRRVIDMIQVKLNEKQQELRLDIPSHFAKELVSDELRLSQILINLLSNAVKFTPEEGCITLKVSLEGDDDSLLIMEVSDTGVGIAPEHLPNIFQSFEQADGSITRRYGGTGLGLAICHNLTALMGGKIWAQSELGKGSRFVLELPVSWGGAIDGPSAAHLEPGNMATSSASGEWQGRHIMLVEDIEVNRELVIGVLEDTGLIIDCAENGQQAIDLFLAAPQKYSLILMDVQMPVLDGYSATRKIRAIGSAGRKVPIYAMTANAFKEDEQAAKEAGMDGHLAKPLNMEALFSILRQELA